MSRNKREGKYMGKVGGRHERCRHVWVQMRRSITPYNDITTYTPILPIRQKRVSFEVVAEGFNPVDSRPIELYPKEMTEHIRRILEPRK